MKKKNSFLNNLSVGQTPINAPTVQEYGVASNAANRGESLRLPVISAGTLDSD